MSELIIAEMSTVNVTVPEDLFEAARWPLRLKAQIKVLQKEETSLKGELLESLRAAG